MAQPGKSLTPHFHLSKSLLFHLPGYILFCLSLYYTIRVTTSAQSIIFGNENDPNTKGRDMTKLVFLIDVDNTLLDNDAIKTDYQQRLHNELGETLTRRFWHIYEQVREDTGVVDIPETLTRFREQIPHKELPEASYLRILSAIDNYPFAEALYPQTLQTIKHLKSMGQAVIVSDGDDYFQARKIIRSHLAAAVDSCVLLYTHKQEHLDEIRQLYPGDHYVVIDDKPTILIDIKNHLRQQSTTIFVQQGKYAAQAPEHFRPDITINHLADLQQFHRDHFLSGKINQRI